MLFSMTGYGKAECDLSRFVYSIEIRSLNSKQLDISIKIPPLLKDMEPEIHKLISRELQRGKIDFSIYQDVKPDTPSYSVNREVVLEYVRQLADVAGEMGMDKTESLFLAAMRMPDAVKSEKMELKEEEWHKLTQSMEQALKELTAFRKQEGRAMEKDIRLRVKNILGKLEGIVPLEKRRIQNIRTRISGNLVKLDQQSTVDPERFEQEMVYYLEKSDITEEQVRLKNHCEYFLESMNGERVVGKKLGFIAQEIGREVNTLGSKAYDPDIQRLVVEMKDELEKIREQVLNIL